MDTLNSAKPQTLHTSFQTIALVGKPRNDINLQMHKNLFFWLIERGYHVLVEQDIGKKIELPPKHLASLEEIGQSAQLAIVIGGDGNMLGRARILAEYHIPLIGINRGNLGFLTDIDPKNAYSQLQACLENGEFFVEERFLLKACVERDNEIIASSIAVNEVVIHPAKIAHMIDFRLFSFRRWSDFNPSIKCHRIGADVSAHPVFTPSRSGWEQQNFYSLCRIQHLSIRVRL